MKLYIKNKYLKILIFSFIAIMAGFAAHAFHTKNFNEKFHPFDNPSDSKKSCYFEIKPRGGISDSWDKVDVPVNGKITTLKGCTYEGKVFNYSKYKIDNWTLKINIHDDCFINNGWCGTVEIHQFHDNKNREVVQTLDLRNLNRDDIILDYITVGQDTLITLHDGDYITYNLSESANEIPINAYNNTLTFASIGFIFYYDKSKDIDLSDFSGSYSFYKGFYQGIEPVILIIIWILWGICLIIYISIRIAYKQAKEESEKRIAALRMKELEEYNKEISESKRQLEESYDVIHAVSDIYFTLYTINLENYTYCEVTGEPIVSQFMRKFSDAKEAFDAIPEYFFDKEEIDKVKDLYNIDSWKEKLIERDTITGDFLAKNKGWVRTTIIVSKRNKYGDAIHVLWTVQDVDRLVKEEQEQKRKLKEANRIMKSYNQALNADVEKKTLHIKEIQTKVVRGLANVIGNRDMDTVGHVNRTSDVIKIIVEEYKNQIPESISEEMAYDIVRAAPMHDLGKIYIDTDILCKPGRFTQEEYDKMKMHSTFSGDIVNLVLKDVEEPHFVQVAFNVARFHHERWDGNGYPDKLSGENIPVEARLMAIADVYDALVSKRCYKESLSFDKAFEIMMEGMGSQFDPSMKNIVIAVREKLEDYYKSQNS